MSNLTRFMICTVMLLAVVLLTVLIWIVTPQNSGFPLMVGGVAFTIVMLCLGFLFDPQPQY